MLKKYDGLFIFSGSLKDEALEKAVERTAAEIVRLGGTIDESDVLGRRAFARPMKKRDNGVYVRIRFHIEPSKLTALRERFRLNDEVFRMQVLAHDARYQAVKAADKARRAAHRDKQEAAQEAARAASETLLNEEKGGNGADDDSAG